ncbi:beta-galactosidase-1-like protein 2 [Dasypus novemcinctus]|uniref:beta-galactosidase-1-like protein 2 n=1 Tax=Dasypus novemcinctus TaxID=9361 RepID=UPI000328E091|nr:beta-galactosidase-1-like protein 2 [Dasypus novemcinctus]
MGAFQARLACVLCLSSASWMAAALPGRNPFRIDQSHLTPSHRQTRGMGLKVTGSNFTLDGFRFLIVAGTMHYFRVPREYWLDRLRKMRACGFNTVVTHIPWNLHEPKRGQFIFTGNLDVMAFLFLASEVGLWAILCPGPYIGSDLDLGGLPSWLLQDSKMKLRTTYRGFTKAVDHYFDELISRIAPLQYQYEGPVIAVQMENEYGSYHLDKNYMSFVKRALMRRGIKVLLMTADNGKDVINGHSKNVLATLHLKNIRKETYTKLSSIQGQSPIMMMLYTTSSFDMWGVARHFQDSNVMMENVRDMFKLRFSLNFYMFHGGTNFGFMGGATDLNGYHPMVTSYDYTALLTEDGEYTSEYIMYEEFFSQVIEVPESVKPERIPKTAYESITPTHFLSLWDVLPYLDEKIKSFKPINMERLSVNQGNGQSFGYTVYETSITRGGYLYSGNHVRDRGQVFLDKQYIGVLDHSTDNLAVPQNQDKKKAKNLTILVENQGRLAYGQNINKERKGITGDIYLDHSPLRRFTISCLDMTTNFIERNLPNHWKSITPKTRGPAFFLGYLKIDETPNDTFINLEGWNKGVIFINGKNLGRYWKIGPQKALYLPGPWLQLGRNEIIVFEEYKPGLKIQFTNTPDLGY